MKRIATRLWESPWFGGTWLIPYLVLGIPLAYFQPWGSMAGGWLSLALAPVVAVPWALLVYALGGRR